MRRMRLAPGSLAVLAAAAIVPATAGARADATATETCLNSSQEVAVTTVVDLNALAGLSGADLHFNNTPLGLTCATVPTD
jgi:hypothetical protein